MIGLIGNVTLQNQSNSIDMQNVQQSLSKISAQLEALSIDPQSAKGMIMELIQARCVEMTIGVNTSHSRQNRWIEGVDPVDKLAIGIMLYEGNKDVAKDFIKATRYLYAALDAGKMEANYYLGMIFRSHNGAHRCDKTAFEFFQNGARAKHPRSMTKVGSSYLMGIGTEYDLSLGYAYLKKGADAGDLNGMFMLSWQMLYGQDQHKNVARAFQLSEELLELGYVDAKANLADCYMFGLGVERDAPKAVQLWKDALAEGRDSLTVELGQCYEYGLGVEQDFSKAAEYYKMGTDVTSNTYRRPRVQPYYGMCLIRGRGVPQDVKAGWAHIQSSVHADIDSGWFMQGECYRYGYGVRKNLRRAVHSYEKAISSPTGNAGTLRAQYALGCMYEAGEGVACDYSKAFDLYNASANNFYCASQWKVATFCESGLGIDQDLVRAVAYFRYAANAGHRNAQIKATRYYMEGKGVQRNLMTAAEIIQPAADGSDREAKELLRRI